MSYDEHNDFKIIRKTGKIPFRFPHGYGEKLYEMIENWQSTIDISKSANANLWHFGDLKMVKNVQKQWFSEILREHLNIIFVGWFMFGRGVKKGLLEFNRFSKIEKNPISLWVYINSLFFNQKTTQTRPAMGQLKKRFPWT